MTEGTTSIHSSTRPFIQWSWPASMTRSGFHSYAVFRWRGPVNLYAGSVVKHNVQLHHKDRVWQFSWLLFERRNFQDTWRGAVGTIAPTECIFYKPSPITLFVLDSELEKTSEQSCKCLWGRLKGVYRIQVGTAAVLGVNAVFMVVA